MKALRHILTAEGRQAWAFAALVGGCVTFTLFAAFGVYILRNDAEKAFWLALAAHGQILIGMTALSALLVKRTLKVSKDGVEISDEGNQ